MVPPLSDVGVSLKTTEILRELAAVRDHEARLNRALEEDGKPALEPFFYSREQWAELCAEHTAALEALKPAAPMSAWEADKQRRAAEKTSAHTPASPYKAFADALLKAHAEPPAVEMSAAAALDTVAAALADTRFRTAGMLREALKPAIMLVPRPPVDAARQRHITSWLDTVASSWTAVLADRAAAGPAAPSDHLPPPPPAPRAIAAIDGDNVVPIGNRAAIVDFIKRSVTEAENPHGGSKGPHR